MLRVFFYLLNIYRFQIGDQQPQNAECGLITTCVDQNDGTAALESNEVNCADPTKVCLSNKCSAMGKYCHCIDIR